MKRMRTAGAGVTLIELLVVLGLLAILAALAAPALGQMVLNQRQSTAARDIWLALALTRSEAIRQGRRMVLCRSADGSGCAPSGDWSQGWILFADPNHNAQRDASEAVLQVWAAVAPGVRVRGNTPVMRYVSYMPQGHTELVSGAFQAGTITVCRAGASSSPAQQIVISRSGRPRLQQSTVGSCL